MKDLLPLVFLLLITAVVVPYISYNFDQPLTPRQLEVLKVLSIIAGVKSVVVFVLGEATRNLSQVDKLWSLMPGIYAWIMVVMGEWNKRLVIMAGLITLWGIRLTFNFWKKGGYTWKFWEGEEDYRWAYVRKNSMFKN